MNYDPSGFSWRSPVNNNTFGPASLIYGPMFSNLPREARYTFAIDHAHYDDHMLWSIPRLYIEFCSVLENNEEGFWLWLIPDSKSRELFLKHKKVQKNLEPFRDEVRLRKIKALEAIAWEQAAAGKATFFQALDKRYGLTEKAQPKKDKTEEKKEDNPFAASDFTTLFPTSKDQPKVD